MLNASSWLGVGLGLVLAIPVALSAVRVLPESSMGYLPPLETMFLFPQGWAFFTRSPGEMQLSYYEVESRETISLVEGPHALSFRHAFGFSRASRAHGVEAALVASAVPAMRWETCKGGIEGCADTMVDAVPISTVNPTPSPRLCGDLIAVQGVSVPWAWAVDARERNRTVSMPIEYARLNVECVDE